MGPLFFALEYILGTMYSVRHSKPTIPMDQAEFPNSMTTTGDENMSATTDKISDMQTIMAMLSSMDSKNESRIESLGNRFKSLGKELGQNSKITNKKVDNCLKKVNRMSKEVVDSANYLADKLNTITGQLDLMIENILRTENVLLNK